MLHIYCYLFYTSAIWCFMHLARLHILQKFILLIYAKAALEISVTGLGSYYPLFGGNKYTLVYLKIKMWE